MRNNVKNKKYEIGDVVDLDDVVLSLATYQAWQANAEAAAGALAAAGRLTDPSLIPDEQGLLLADGSLEIFVEIPGVARVSMRAPVGHWRFR